MTSGRKKESKRKEMKIILRSKPLNTEPKQTTQFTMKSKRKPKDFKKKGTRGPSWIG